ncbi:MAG: GrpB family protein [Deinococcales bacterium]
MTNSKIYRHSVQIVDYDPNWVQIFAAEKELLLAHARAYLLAIEHIGSTAIPGQRAKPIIDIMAAVQDLADFTKFSAELEGLGYELFEMGMKERYFLRRQDSTGQSFHLHIVSLASWPERKERLMRDYLLKHPEDVIAYGKLKDELVKSYGEDSIAYTEAKTSFIQGVMDRARAALNLPPIDVSED